MSVAILLLMAVLFVGLCLLVVAVVAIRSRSPNRPLTDLEKDYDEGPRGREER